jgi:hypothetical protein
VILAATVWQHKTEKVLNDFLGSDSFNGKIPILQLSPCFYRHGAVNGLLGKLVQVGGESVHKSIAENPEGRVVHREGRGDSAITASGAGIDGRDLRSHG